MVKGFVRRPLGTPPAVPGRRPKPFTLIAVPEDNDLTGKQTFNLPGPPWECPAANVPATDILVFSRGSRMEKLFGTLLEHLFYLCRNLPM